MPTLPRGLSSADFSAALGKFAAALGADQVVTADEDVALYSILDSEWVPR